MILLSTGIRVGAYVNVNVSQYWPSPRSLPSSRSPPSPRLGPCHHCRLPPPPASLCFNFQARRRVCPQAVRFRTLWSSHLLFPPSPTPFEYMYFISYRLQFALFFSPDPPRSVAIASHDIYKHAYRHVLIIDPHFTLTIIIIVIGFVIPLPPPKKAHSHVEIYMYIIFIYYKYMYRRGVFQPHSRLHNGINMGVMSRLDV